MRTALPSYLYRARFLRGCRWFIYRARRTIVLALHKTYRISARAGVSKIYHANITQTRYAVAREIPPPSTSARFPFCALFVRSANFSCENAGAHIKHGVIPLNPASGINRRYTAWVPRATGIKIKFFNKIKLSTHLRPNFFVPLPSRLFLRRWIGELRGNENAKKRAEKFWKKVRDPVREINASDPFFFSFLFDGNVLRYFVGTVTAVNRIVRGMRCNQVIIIPLLNEREKRERERTRIFKE